MATKQPRKVVHFVQGSPYPALAERPAASAPSGPPSLGTKTDRQSAVDRTREEKADPSSSKSTLDERLSENTSSLPHLRPASDNLHNRPPPPSTNQTARAFRERSASVSCAHDTRDRSRSPQGTGAKRPASAPYVHYDLAPPPAQRTEANSRPRGGRVSASDTRHNRPPPGPSWRTKPERVYRRGPVKGTVGWYLRHDHHHHDEEEDGDGGEGGCDNGGSSHRDGGSTHKDGGGDKS